MPATPDLNSYYMVHDAMRRGSAQLATAIAGLVSDDRHRAAALRWYADGVIAELHQHHVTEDELFFPTLAARVPTFEALDHGLRTDHDRLDEVMTALADAMRDLAGDGDWDGSQARARVAADELARLLDDHLTIEDGDVLPLFERHFSAAEYDKLDREALKRIKLRHLLFTVPWVISTASPEAAQQVLATGPVLVRLVWRLTRRSYSRRASLALGAAIPAVVR